MPLAFATTLAKKLVDELALYCQCIEIAGSVRRQVPEVGDIELVAIPKFAERPTVAQQNLFEPQSPSRLERVSLLDQRLEQMQVLDHDRPIFRSRLKLLEVMGERAIPGTDVQRWGERYKRFYLKGNNRHRVVAVDLFIACPDNWGAIFCLRTGPGDFSKALVTHLNYNTPYRQNDGYLIRAATGAVVPVPEESDYFAYAKLIYLPPEKRTVDTLKKARAAWVQPPRVTARPTAGESSMCGGGIAESITPYALDTSITEWLRTRLLAGAGV